MTPFSGHYNASLMCVDRALKTRTMLMTLINTGMFWCVFIANFVWIARLEDLDWLLTVLCHFASPIFWREELLNFPFTRPKLYFLSSFRDQNY